MNGYPVCEHDMDIPDPTEVGFSLTEIDIYATVPHIVLKEHPEIKNHRLTLRKNLSTKEYFAFEKYYRSKQIKIVFSSKDLKETLDFIDKRWVDYWGDFNKGEGSHTGHVICSHGADWTTTRNGCTGKR